MMLGLEIFACIFVPTLLGAVAWHMTEPRW